MVLSQLELEYSELQTINPRLVVTAITPFGQSGPYSQYKSYPLNTFHAGGEGYLTPGGSTFLDRPPIRCGKFVGEYESATSAIAATMLALYFQQTTGQGQFVDISQQQCLTWLTGFDLFRWPNYGVQVTRFTRGYTYTGVLACKDGWVMYSPMRDDEWDAMVEVIGGPPGHQTVGQGAGPRSLWPGQGEGSNPGVPGGASSARADERPYPVLCGPPGRGQDIAGEGDRRSHGTGIHPHLPRRRA